MSYLAYLWPVVLTALVFKDSIIAWWQDDSPTAQPDLQIHKYQLTRARLFENPPPRVILQSALKFHEIATQQQIHYCFGGAFAAWLYTPDDDFSVFELETILDPSVNGEVLEQLFEYYSEDISITPEGHHVIFPHRDGVHGVATRSFVAGGDFFGDELCVDLFELIPPAQSPFRALYNDNNPFPWLPTYQYVAIPGYNVSLPVLRVDLLLRQRLRQFARDMGIGDKEAKSRMRNSIVPIRVFIRVAGESRPLPPGVNDLTDIVREWVKYTNIMAHAVTPQEQGWLQSLGVVLREEDLVV